MRERRSACRAGPDAAGDRTRAVTKPWRAHPEVVTLKAEEGEELVYGEATPVIVEWRRQRIASLDRGASRVERARAGLRTCELELVLIGDYELTLPPSTYPWDEFRLEEERHRCERSLRRARPLLALRAAPVNARAVAPLNNGGSPVTAPSRPPRRGRP